MDRRARIREYKETPRPMGVYRVRNTANGKYLVGASADLPAMLNRQRFQLEAGSHPSRPLQRDWQEFGAAAFAFEILDTLAPSEEPGSDAAADLRVLEEMWRQKLALTDGPGYGAGGERA
jgi:hypothetical protein